MITVLAGAATWLVLARRAAVVVGKCIALRKAVPVPVPDADWLDGVPVDCLGQDEIDGRFRQIVGTRSTFQGLA